jgi:hypothetical protein
VNVAVTVFVAASNISSIVLSVLVISPDHALKKNFGFICVTDNIIDGYADTSNANVDIPGPF